MQNWYVYLARCSDDSLYCGITTDLERRFKEHNGELAGGAKYTKSKRPVQLCVYAICDSRKSASQLEARVKALPRLEKITALQNYVEDNSDD